MPAALVNTPAQQSCENIPGQIFSPQPAGLVVPVDLAGAGCGTLGFAGGQRQQPGHSGAAVRVRCRGATKGARSPAACKRGR